MNTQETNHETENRISVGSDINGNGELCNATSTRILRKDFRLAWSLANDHELTNPEPQGI